MNFLLGFYYVCVEFNPARSNVSLKRRRKKVEKRALGDRTTRDVNPTAMRGEEQQRARDQIVSSLNLNSNSNAKPPDTDMEMDVTEDSNNLGREAFVGVEMDNDMQMDVTAGAGAGGLEDVSTPPSRSRSLNRGGVSTTNSRHSRSRTRRRRRREEQQYDRYRMANAIQNVVAPGNTTPVAVPISLSNPNSNHPTAYSVSNPGTLLREVGRFSFNSFFSRYFVFNL